MAPLSADKARKGLQLWFALVTLAMAGVILLGYVLWSAYSETWRDAESTANSYAEVLETRLDTVLRRVDADLQMIIARLPHEALVRDNAQGLREEIEKSLEQHRVSFPEVSGFRVIDAHGDLLYLAGGGKYANLDDRDYFVALRDTRAPGIFFSQVITSRITGRPVLVAARALRSPDGRFLGVVSAPLELNYFERIFKSIHLGKNGALAVRRLDNHGLAFRQPPAPGLVNQVLPTSSPLVQKLSQGEKAGAERLTSTVDGVQRIYAYRALDDFPFYVVAGLSNEDVNADWQRRAILMGGLGVVLFLGMSLVLIWLFRNQEAEFLSAEKLRRNQEQLREAQRLARVGSWELDLLSGKLVWSDELFHIFERDPANSVGSYEFFLEMVHPEDRQMVDQAYRDSVAKRIPYEIEHRLLMPDGRIKVILECGETLFDDAGMPLRSIGTAQDISGLRQMESQMQLLGVAFQHSGEAILITDAKNNIVTVNPAFSALTGYSLDEALGRNPRFLSAGRNSPEDYSAMWLSIREKGFWQGEIWDRRKDGGIYPKWMSVSVIRDEAGEIRYHIAHFTDISVERAAEEKLHHIAHHDSLTGLPNRFSLSGRIQQALALARRDGGRVALLFIDLDRFKLVNDTLGHHVGDELLIEVAHRLQDSVRDSDVVARLGGDEFVIMLTGIEHTSSVAVVAEKVVLAVGSPYLIEGHDLYTSPSIGIAVFPTDGETGDVLMKNADAAMYHAKSAGRNNFQFFDVKMNEVAVERLSIEHSLRQALARDEFCLYFQPIIDVASGRVVEVEALIRWMHPQQGMIPPIKFIGIAEETGLIQPIGEWVFWTACRMLSEFNEAGLAGVKMGINISAMQMRNGNLPILARGAIQALSLNPEDLVFEITESVAMQRPEETVAILDLLHNMGIGLAIDDFGTGYSSLSYLKMFPIDHIKLDRSFVEEIGQGGGSSVICDATIGLAHNLGLKLVAEGVETEEQFAYLRERACDLVQGYLFSRPVPAKDVIAFIRQRNG
jgi:diguanylate cyclase (GGDEF)-like protein/PAS domain S-box-containing protein